MAYTYDTYTSALCTLMVTSTADTNFVAIEPSIIDYAENRIYRELDLLDTETGYVTTATSGISGVAIPSSISFITARYVNIYTPVGAVSCAVANTIPPVSRETIDMLWPDPSVTGLPQMFSMPQTSFIALGPTPDASYQISIIGALRPTALSSGNPTTLLTTYTPDLFIAASMVFASGYMRNFGSQADNSQMAVSWESQYQILKQSAMQEASRQRFAGWGWTSQNVSAPANIKRT
jgi:hypothetical protein